MRVAWLSLSLYTGAFAIKGSNFAELTGAEPAGTVGAGGDGSQVAGAAAAPADTTGPAHLDVVPTDNADGQSAAPVTPDSGSASDPAAGQNIIPF